MGTEHRPQGQLPRKEGIAKKKAAFAEVSQALGDDLCCLLRLSEYYGLEHLKEFAEESLSHLLTPESVIPMASHAYHCEADQLLRLCIFNLRRMYADIVGSPDWEELEPAVKDIVMQDVTQEATRTAATTTPGLV